MIRLLFVDDDPKAHTVLKMVLDSQYSVRSAYTAAHGLELARAESPEVVLLDINLPDRSGLDILEPLLQLPAAPAVVILTVFSDVRLVVDAVKLGAFDYIVKPYELDNLLSTVRRAARSVAGAQRTEDGPAELRELIGESPAMAEVRDLVLRYGPAELPVLVTGESGTGKELVARALHAVSGRRGSFVAVNCGALPQALVESELFGVERGAYTDATPRAGQFERANGGTLFLDEIGEMPLSSQAKLLRVLERGQVRRLGAEQPSPVDVRLVAATSREVGPGSGFLREDLYYRIGVLTVELPPLRERRSDIPLLASCFLKNGHRLSASAVDRLMGHDWPGNVRELRNVLARAQVLAGEDTIDERQIRF